MTETTVAGTTADPNVEYVPLKLGKREYQLCYDFDAIARAEDITGMPLLLGVDWHNMKSRELRALLYAAALKAQPDAKLADFTPYIRPAHTGAIVAALIKVWVTSNAEKEEDAENPPTPAPAPANL